MYNKRFCKEPEKIENYEKAKKDNFKGWRCHHRLETHTSDGERRAVDISVEELKSLGMYYHRPSEELIFLTISEHRSLHDEGENHPMYGKHHSEESKKRIGAGNRGKKLSEETRNKMSEAKKGNKYALGNTNTKGTRWYNNVKINIRAKECPEGFTPGMLR